MKLNFLEIASIVFVLLLGFCSIFYYKKYGKKKAEIVIFQKTIDSLSKEMINDSLFIGELKKASDDCTNSSLEKAKYFEKRMNDIYGSLKSNRALIESLQNKKDQVNTSDWEKNKLIEYINQNY